MSVKVVLAFDSFKGSMTAPQAVSAAAEGVLEACPEAEVVSLPMADGGEGTAEILCHYMKANSLTCSAHDPLMRPIEAQYAISADSQTAIMDMATAAGLTLLSTAERNPMVTTTFGFGEMIRDAVARGCGHILIGIGGSSTCDCGMGMLAALGVVFRDKGGNLLEPIGRNLTDVASIEWGGLLDLEHVALDVMCDVENPLYGENGTAMVYARQKGATDADIAALERGLRHFASLCDLDPDTPGSGAAGGLGYALLLLGARLHKGAELVMRAARLDEHLRGADLILTGEGKIDSQTLNGKLPYAVMLSAGRASVPCVALCGKVDDGFAYAGFKGVYSINKVAQEADNVKQTEVAMHNMRATAALVVQEFCLPLHR